jgi:protease-4
VAKRRLVKFFATLVAIFLLVAVLAMVAGWVLVGRGPRVAEHSTLILRVGGNLVETPPNDVIGQVTGGSHAQTVRGYVEVLRKAKNDSRIDTVLLVPTRFESPYWAKVQEIRDAVIDFRTSGKRVNAYLEDAGEREYYLATAADRIFMLPTSPLDLKGLASYEVFLRGTLDKIGAQADFEHIGEFKTAPNQLTEHGFTPAHREMSESLNRDMFEQLARGIADGRKKGIEDIKRLIDTGPFLPEQALSAGLVDKLAYEDQLDDVGAMTKSSVEGEEYARGRRSSLGSRAPRIAVIYMSGVIASGKGGFDPVNGDVVGSAALLKAIRAVRADSSLRGIVLRIDSPGGSSTASDVIWRELVVTRDQKPARPLVASMSDLAASGGYYLAMAAQQIVAQPATLTGSIGIFGGKFVTGGTYQKLGANIDSVMIGKNAGMESPTRPFTDSERAKLREELHSFYDQWIQKVATARKMPAARVEELARGRVWTGAQARQNGLVDALGGLDRAVALAKEKAGISAATEVELVSYPPRKTLFELIGEQLTGSSDSEMRLISSWFGTSDRQAFSVLTAPRLFRPAEPLALMPSAFVR